MHTQQLSPHQVEPSHAVERSEEAAIAGEIARRLLDMAETSSRERVIMFISKLYAIQHLDREALWVVLSLMTGDLSAVTESYQAAGKKRGLDKQAMQQQMERVIVSIRKHYPHLATAIVHLRHVTAKMGPQHEEHEAENPIL